MRRRRAARGKAAALAILVAACTRVGTGPPGAPAASQQPAVTPAVPAPTPPPAPPPPAPAGAPPAAAATARVPGAAGTTRPAARFTEVRGLWVVRFSLATPASTRAVVERAARAGFNTLLVQVRGRGDAFYASALEPRAAALARAPADFDPLAQIVREAHVKGIAVHAWMNVDLVADYTTVPTDPRHLARAHPEALMVPRALARELAGVRPGDPRYAQRLIEWSRANNRQVEGLYASPWSPAVRERTLAVATDLAERYDLDGIHFDYIRYPGPNFDYSVGAVAAFREWAIPLVDVGRRRALDRATGANPLAWPDSLPRQWSDFRRQQLTSLLERIHFAVKARRPWMVVSAAVYPDTVDARGARFQDWPGWARSGLLDAVAPMAYTADDRRFRGQVEEVVAAAPGTEVWAGIGSHLTGLQGTLRKIGIARELGTHGIMLFSYDWTIDPKGGGGEAFLERVGRSWTR